MLIWSMIKVAAASLASGKMRSFLAMLGIIIGVAAVIAMLAIGSGAQRQVLDRFAAMGASLLSVRPGQRGSHGVVSGTQQNLTLEDAQAIAREVAGVKAVAPGVSGSAQLKYLNKNARTQVQGTSYTYFALRNIEIDRGRRFTEQESDRMAKVAVIGPEAAKNVFGADDPLDATVKINGIAFKIIGIAKAKGAGWNSPDERVIIPYSTAMKQLLGLDYLNQIDIQSESDKAVAKVEEATTLLLRKRHRIAKDDENDFSIFNMAEIRDSASEVTGIFKWMLGGIAAISLVVGGIGIMNIMLVVVTERTREIGVRKAIGAREEHILLQFLVESIIVSVFGGLLGLGLGVAVAKAVNKFSPMPAVVDANSAILAMSLASLVGVFFGLYPAWRAARLDPVEALRYE